MKKFIYILSALFLVVSFQNPSNVFSEKEKFIENAFKDDII